MPVHFQVSFKESMRTDQSLTICNSEVFYIPRRFVPDFIDLVNLVGDLDVHQKVAIPMFFVSMDLPQNFDSVLGTMIYRQEPPSTNSSTFYSPEVPAIHPVNVSSEQEFIKLIRIMAAGDPLLMELVWRGKNSFEHRQAAVPLCQLLHQILYFLVTILFKGEDFFCRVFLYNCLLVGD